MHASLRIFAVWFSITLYSATCYGQGLLVKAIVLPEGATDVSYSKSRGDVRFNAPTDMKTVGEFYSTTLTDNQWTKSKKDNLQKSFWVQTFSKQGATLEVRTQNRAGGSEVRLTPTGMLWDEDLAPKVKDLPIPAEAGEIKYDAFFEAIEYQHALSVKELVDFYTTKLDGKLWIVTGTDELSERYATLKRKAGTASIGISISTDNQLRRVRIKTKGMDWEEIKKANALAEKMQAANQPASSATSENVAPQRKAKPVKGIDILEKLVSKCTLTMDGKAIELKEFTAFEAIHYGSWRTYIIASTVPLKHNTLIPLLKANIPDEKWGETWKLPTPFVQVALDENDKPISMQLIADNIPGSESDSALKGEAIVENGRARGAVSLTKGTFFKHTFSVEMTFDVSLLTGKSVPQNIQANLPKLENKGTIVMAGRTVTLSHVVAYQRVTGNDTVTCVIITEKALDPAKTKAALDKTGTIDISVIGFQPQIEYTINSNDEVQAVSFYCDGASMSLSAQDKLDTAVQSSGTRVRGTAKLRTPQDFFGKKIEFQTSFDTTLLNAKSDQQLQKK